MLLICFGGVEVLLFCEIPFFSTLQTSHNSSLTSIWTSAESIEREFGFMCMQCGTCWRTVSHDFYGTHCFSNVREIVVSNVFG